MARERGAVARGAVDDDRLHVVGRGRFDAGLEVAARDVHGAGDLALVPLVLLPDVEEERRVGPFEELAGACCVHFLDLGANLLQELAIGRHDFP